MPPTEIPAPAAAARATTCLAAAFLALALGGCSRPGTDAAGPPIPTTAGTGASSAVAPEALPASDAPASLASSPAGSDAALGGAPGASAGAAAASEGAGAAGGGVSQTGDAGFLAKASASGKFQLRAAEIAVQKATRPEVKAFAETLVRDHTVANAEIVTLASAHQATLPKGPDPSHQAALTGLDATTGPSFDKAWLEGIVIHQHQIDLQTYAIESVSGQAADLKDWAAKASSTLNHHLADAQKLAAAAPK